MSELALAAFAAETDSHLVAVPRGERFARFSRRFDERGYLAGLARRGLRWLPRSSPAFPRRLAAIFDPPPGLFLRGSAAVELLERPSVAIVGARACSPYGAQVAHMLGRELAAAGLVVVSGLARGVDGHAHRGALESGGITVAVLGCGIDRDYPAVHAELARRVCERGLVVSEYPPGVEPAPWRFPARNRIVAGLVQAVVVVEARERSGALITADLALEEGREVFAVPGEISSSLSAGSNRLLRSGAAALTAPEDVLELFGLDPVERRETHVSAAAASVLARLRDGPAAPDELVRALELDAGRVAAALSELELAGAVAEMDGCFRALGVRRMSV
ncbi:MAG TPA: DNA-processing protein DprA [Gaiellaceae bacterium]|nr:DNA-processing protein DprA [Gaiellaceae bacterium]